MSDHTAGGPGVHHVTRTPKAEYHLYFALIFILAVPFSALAWIARLVIDRRLPVHGPFARAWHEAGAITPQIFRP